MKPIVFAAVSAASIFVASCNKGFMPEVTAFTASVEQIADESCQLLWNYGDEIAVYDAGRNRAVCRLADGNGTANGVFESDEQSELARSAMTEHCLAEQNDRFSSNSGTGLSQEPYSAVYPAAISASRDNVSLPAVQRSSDGTLQKPPMYAISTNTNLRFHHLCGVVRFRFTDSLAVSLSSIAVTTAGVNTNGNGTVSGYGTDIALSALDGTATTTLLFSAVQSLASARDIYMYLPVGTYYSFVVTLTDGGDDTCTYTPPQAVVIRRGAITTITLQGLRFGSQTIEGTLPGHFSVSRVKTVQFSKGNLQYNAMTSTWRFAEHQFDVIGSGNARISATYNNWIDLFGWGTSGWNNGNYWYWPHDASDVSNSQYNYDNGFGYGPTNGEAYNLGLTGRYANADWGVYNAISNGGNAPGLWRTLSYAEWIYLITKRSGSTVNGVPDARWALAQIIGVGGIILFPDSYTHPPEVPLPQNINAVSYIAWGGNSYSFADWRAMEAAGAVFLPAAGRLLLVVVVR